jgi:hypothetical protein
MRWFDVTLKATETNNFQTKMLYLISDRDDGLKLIPDLVKRFSFFYPVRNLHFGGQGLFSTFNRDYAHLFHEVFELPVLRGEETRMLFNLKTYPAEVLLLKNTATQALTVPTLSRVRLLQWQLKIMDEFMDNMIDSTDPNIRIELNDDRNAN